MTVGIFFTPGGTTYSAFGFNHAHNQIGHNTGNSMFQFAVSEHILNPKTYISLSTPKEWVKKNIDLIVFPAANQLNPNWDLGDYANFLDEVNKPIVIVGLGAQAKERGNLLDFKEGTKNFVKVLDRLAKFISVRGEYSGKVLKSLGCDKYTVAGCPSNFINPDLSLGDKIDKKIRAILDKKQIVSSQYNFGTMEDYSRDIEKKLFKLAIYNNSTFMYQTNERMFKFLLGQRSDEILNYLNWEHKVLAPEMNSDNYIDHLAKNGVFYSDARNWIDFVSRIELSYGMRIHGAVAAIQGGSVGVCVCFDSRTTELSETLQVPHIQGTEIQPQDNLIEILRKSKFDGGKFNTNRKELASKYFDGLKSSGIEIAERYKSFM